MLSQLEKSEIMHRTKSMRDEELYHAIKFIPTNVLLYEISRRDSRITETLSSMCDVWDDLTLDKSMIDMNIEEKENLIKNIRRVLYYGE